MNKIKSIPGTKPLLGPKGPVAYTKYAALHLPTATYLCYYGSIINNPYKLYGSPEKGRRGLTRFGAHPIFRLSDGSDVYGAGGHSKGKSITHQFEFVKAFTFIKFPNGDKILRIFISVPTISVFKNGSCLKQIDLDYFKDHPERVERVIYENHS